MKERPILFSGPMVRAILAGTKTQTRRVMKPQPPSVEAVRAKSGDSYHLADLGKSVLWRVMGPVWAVRDLMEGDPVDAKVRADVGPQWRCPYGAPGDRLWVRETFQLFDPHPDADGDLFVVGQERMARGRKAPYVGVVNGRPIEWTAAYRADGELEHPTDGAANWKPAIHMPRWASRITLEIASVRVERLHDITEDDARGEGVDACDGLLDAALICRAAKVIGASHEDARGWFAALWAEINGWESLVANPWLWCLTFRRVDAGARDA